MIENYELVISVILVELRTYNKFFTNSSNTNTLMKHRELQSLPKHQVLIRPSRSSTQKEFSKKFQRQRRKQHTKDPFIRYDIEVVIDNNRDPVSSESVPVTWKTTDSQ